MNKSEIVETLQLKYPKIKLDEIELIFNILIKNISDSLKGGKNIEIRGFGTIAKKTNKEKYVRNPKTNEKIFKNETFKLHFKIGKTLHKRLNELKNNE
tara:strand:- start:892 stop:1185 length:294 start_codon:yes stop_codon:yes gene_type:complete